MEIYKFGRGRVLQRSTLRKYKITVSAKRFDVLRPFKRVPRWKGVCLKGINSEGSLRDIIQGTQVTLS